MKLIILCFLFLIIDSGFTQDLSFLSPHSAKTVVEFDQLFSPPSGTGNSYDKSKLHFSNLSLGHTHDFDKRSLGGGVRYQSLNLSGNNPELSDYYNIQASVAYRQMMRDDNFWMLSGSYGSASDRPFENGRDNAIQVNYLQKFSPRWFGILNYSNNRSFLNNIPLPGFFWVKEMTLEKTLIIGFPFIYWMRPMSEKWSIRYLGLIPWTHRLKFIYKTGRSFNPYFGFEQAPQNYFRHAREDKKDRFFWFERKIGLGFEGSVTPAISLDFFSGLAFDRSFFEAEDFGLKKQLKNNLDNSIFAALLLKYAI